MTTSPTSVLGRFATSFKVGLPLPASINQTILPVMSWPSGKVHGFFPITSTTFLGSETSFTLPEGAITITTVTLPQNKNRVGAFMAAVYVDPAYQNKSMQDTGDKNTSQPQALQAQALAYAAILSLPSSQNSPWLGYHTFVNTNNTGYVYRHIMGTEAWFSLMNSGNLIGSLNSSMSKVVTSPAPQGAPTAGNGALRWVATMNVSSNNLPNLFFDFNWQAMFSASSTSSTPLTLTVNSNPAGGALKAVLVTGANGQTLDPNGNVQFTTVRIIKIGDVVPGVYNFTFSVVDNLNQTTPVTLALTIV